MVNSDWILTSCEAVTSERIGSNSRSSGSSSSGIK